MKTARASLAALLVILLAAVLTVEASPRLSDVQAEQIIDSLGATNPIAAADLLSTGWRNADAVRVLETHADTTDADVLWRLARSRIDIGEAMEDQDAAQPQYELAIDEANRILETDANNPEAHIRIATASGRVALLKGPFSTAGLVKDTYRHAHLAAVEADSMPVAYYILGRTHRTLMAKSGLARRLAGLTFASDDSIAYYFKKALHVANGKMIQARVEYADYLIEQGILADEARAQLDAALELPLRDEHDEAAQEKARKLLAKL